MWLGILLAYDSYYWPPLHHGWPVSFFVVTLVLLAYLASRVDPGARARRGPADRCSPASWSTPGSWRRSSPSSAAPSGSSSSCAARRSSPTPIPNGSFAGAAAASLIGVNTLLGLGVFSLGGALGIGLLGRRGRHDVATALTLVFMLGLGALFLSFSVEYAPEIYSLLFGEVLGISTNELGPTIALAVVCLRRSPCSTGRCCCPRSSPSRRRPAASALRLELAFLLLVALATTMTVPVVGTALIFSLMIGPPAAARAFTTRPHAAIALSVGIAAGRRLGGDRALLPDQLAGRVLRRRRQRRGLRRGTDVDVRARCTARARQVLIRCPRRISHQLRVGKRGTQVPWGESRSDDRVAQPPREPDS